MKYRIVWTNPAKAHVSETLECPLEWDSRDMAQMAAYIGGERSGDYRRFRAFRIEEVPVGKMEKRRG